MKEEEGVQFRWDRIGNWDDFGFEGGKGRGGRGKEEGTNVNVTIGWIEVPSANPEEESVFFFFNF
jgi:hypothetical protein